MGGGDAKKFVQEVVPTCLNVIVQCVDPNFSAKAGPGVGQAISILKILKGAVCGATLKGASYAVSVMYVFLNALNRMGGDWPGILAKCFMTVAKLCVVAIPTQDIGTARHLDTPQEVKEAALKTLDLLRARQERVDAAMRAVGEGSPHYLKLLQENDIINGHIQFVIEEIAVHKSGEKFAAALRNMFPQDGAQDVEEEDMEAEDMEEEEEERVGGGGLWGGTEGGERGRQCNQAQGREANLLLAEAKLQLGEAEQYDANAVMREVMLVPPRTDLKFRQFQASQRKKFSQPPIQSPIEKRRLLGRRRKQRVGPPAQP